MTLILETFNGCVGAALLAAFVMLLFYSITNLLKNGMDAFQL